VNTSGLSLLLDQAHKLETETLLKKLSEWVHEPGLLEAIAESHRLNPNPMNEWLFTVSESYSGLINWR
jgi:hypothetical protein